VGAAAIFCMLTITTNASR